MYSFVIFGRHLIDMLKNASLYSNSKGGYWYIVVYSFINFLSGSCCPATAICVNNSSGYTKDDTEQNQLLQNSLCKGEKNLLHFLWNVYFSSISTLIKFSLCLLIIYEHTCETTLNKYCFSLLPQYQSKLIMIRCVLRSTCINAEMYFKSFITFT